MPKQTIKYGQVGAKWRLVLKGLVNIEEEVVQHNGGVTLGPKVGKAMRTYGCAFHDMKRCDDRIIIGMSILRVPRKVTLVCEESER